MSELKIIPQTMAKYSELQIVVSPYDNDWLPIDNNLIRIYYSQNLKDNQKQLFTQVIFIN